MLLPVASSWSGENLVTFTEKAYNKTDCNETYNITNFLAAEAANPPNADKLKEYEEQGQCLKFILGAYHWFELNDPKASCQRFYERVEEWKDQWNWAFNDCGINFTKGDLDLLIDVYAVDFFEGNLEIPDQRAANPDINYDNYNNSEQINNEYSDDSSGGGGFDVKIDWNIKLIAIEIMSLLLAFYTARFLWRTKEWEGVPMGGNPGSAIVKGWAKKLKYIFIGFIIWNIIILSILVFIKVI